MEEETAIKTDDVEWDEDGSIIILPPGFATLGALLSALSVDARDAYAPPLAKTTKKRKRNAHAAVPDNALATLPPRKKSRTEGVTVEEDSCPAEDAIETGCAVVSVEEEDCCPVLEIPVKPQRSAWIAAWTRAISHQKVGFQPRQFARIAAWLMRGM